MRRAAWRLPLPTLLYLALLPALLWAQEAERPEELLRRADSLAAGGDRGAAVALYREWLRANGEAEAFGEVLLRAVDAAAEVGDALRLLAEFAPRLRDPAVQEACLERRAALLRLSGRPEEALAVLAGLPETPARLVERAGISLELGLTGEAEQILRRLCDSEDAGIAADARLLLATVYLASGSGAQGEAELRGLIESRPDAPAVPAALLALGEALRARGEAKAAEEVLRDLETRFPASPEAALAGTGTRVRQAPLPLRLLPPGDAGSDGAGLAAGSPAGNLSPSSPSAPPVAPPRAALVQAGSFRDPDNAQYLVRDLAAHGFAARVVEKPIGDSRYYRVVVGPEQNPEQAQELILKLKDAGYEGVLLLE
jgi:tetratricopeptide (TPR) repeat protein